MCSKWLQKFFAVALSVSMVFGTMTNSFATETDEVIAIDEITDIVIDDTNFDNGSDEIFFDDLIDTDEVTDEINDEIEIEEDVLEIEPEIDEIDIDTFNGVSNASPSDVIEDITIEESDDEKYGLMTTFFEHPDIPIPKYDETNFRFFKGTLESSYDSRTKGIVPSIRDQGSYGTCWAFSALGAAEVSMVKDGYATKDEINLSELALAYTYFNMNKATGNKAYLDTPGLEGKDYVYNVPSDPNDPNFTQGGGMILAGAAMSAGISMIDENKFPDTAYSKIENVIAKGLDPKYMLKNGDYTVKNMVLYEKTSPNAIKQAIKDHGAVTLGYGQVPSFETPYVSHKNSAGKFCYYNCNKVDPNHGVLIVGWDDNIPASDFYTENKATGKHICAPGNGGWLIRNSWGADGGCMNEGYFYMSYYDPSITLDDFESFEIMPKDTYDYYYHYDTHGGFGFEEIEGSSKVGQIYQVSNDENQILKAVNLGLANKIPNVNVDISVYVSDSKMDTPYTSVGGGSITNGKVKLASKQTYKFTESGIFTIELNNPVYLKKGSYYSIVIGSSSKIQVMINVSQDVTAGSRRYYNEVEKLQSFRYIKSDWYDINANSTMYAGKTYGNNWYIRGYTVKATDEDTCKVRFNAGSYPYDNELIVIRGTTVPRPADLIKENYRFTNWFNESNCVTLHDFSAPVLTDITIYAGWVYTGKGGGGGGSSGGGSSGGGGSGGSGGGSGPGTGNLTFDNMLDKATIPPGAVTGTPDTWKQDPTTLAWYRIGKDGVSMNGWYKDEVRDTWYFLGLTDYVMQRGYQMIGDRVYYFSEIEKTVDGKLEGELFVNQVTPNGCYANENGEVLGFTIK